MSLALIPEIRDKVTQIHDIIVGGAWTDRLEKIEHGLFNGANVGFKIGSASFMEKIRSNNFVTGSSGWQIDLTGDVEFENGTFRGTIYANAGNIGPGIVLNGTTETIYVGSGVPRLEIDGANKRIRTSTYTSGLEGFTIEGSTGNAEFNNVRVRGELQATVLTYKELHATSGSHIIVKAAGILLNDVTTVASPTTFNVDIKDPVSGHAQLFAVNDILRMKVGTSLDNWMTVQSVSDQTTFYRYVCVLNSGTPGTFKAGQPVLDYGVSGDGGILLTADDTNAPFIRVFEHSGSPWTSITERVRLGNLNGWGPFATDVFGLAMGNYSTGNYFYYDPISDKSAAAFAGNKVKIDDAGITILQGQMSSNKIKSVDSSSTVISELTTWLVTNSIYVELAGRPNATQTYTNSRLYAGSGITSRIEAIADTDATNKYAKALFNIYDSRYGFSIVDLTSDAVRPYLTFTLGGSLASYITADGVGIKTSAPNYVTATLDVARGTLSNGTAQFQGTNLNSNFNYSTAEDTYIRGGKSTSKVVIGDSNAAVWLSKETSILTGANPTATLDVARGTLSNGTAIFRGTTYNSHFNNSTTEDTLIRGGKSTSAVYIADTSTNGTIYLGPSYAPPVRYTRHLQITSTTVSAPAAWTTLNNGSVVVDIRTGRALITWTVHGYQTNPGAYTHWQTRVLLDGATVSGSQPQVYIPATGISVLCSAGSALFTGLTAGNHTFALQAAVFTSSVNFADSAERSATMIIEEV